MQTFFEIYSALLFTFFFCIWQAKGFLNGLIKIALFVGTVSAIIVNYQHFA